MRGKRVRTTRYAARRLSPERRNMRRSKASTAEERALLKLVICGVVFVLIVAIKLLFPQTADSFTRSASLLIGGNADFKEAFAAVGRVAGGEKSVEDSLYDVYSAVFNPYRMRVTVSAKDEQAEKDVINEAATAGYDTPLQPDKAEQINSESANQSEKSETVSGIFMIPSLPDNASMEQRNLGFSYTTPVHGTMSSSFGWREHPVGGETKFHYGLDLAADIGTDICAFADGEIFATGESSTLGKYIILLHAQGYKTLYAHCSAVVKQSGRVSKGEVIAKVGQSGSATGSHLHFELQDGTLYLNPIYYVDLG